MKNTYTWKRIPQPDPVYLIDGRRVTALEFLAEHERRTSEMVGFTSTILGEPWTEPEKVNPATPTQSASPPDAASPPSPSA